MIASKATLKVMESLQLGRYKSLQLRRKKLSHLHEKWILFVKLIMLCLLSQHDMAVIVPKVCQCFLNRFLEAMIKIKEFVDKKIFFKKPALG